MRLLIGPSPVALPDGRKQTVFFVVVILQFMTKNPNMRLGSPGLGGESAILRHPYFKDLDWDLLNQRQMEPPFRPRIVRGKEGGGKGFLFVWVFFSSSGLSKQVYYHETGKEVKGAQP